MQDSGRDQSDERIASLFKRLDTKNEGHLDVEGLRAGLKKINHHMHKALAQADHLIHDIMAAVDTSKDGYIQYEEFKTFFASAERELWTIFKSVDLDNNGRIEKEELKAALLRAGIVVDPPEKLEEFFRSFDKNNDGDITFEEWRDFLMFMPQEASLKTIYSYYLSTVTVNPEGDVSLSDETNHKGIEYFLAGGMAGVLSRTATAPFDRIKVYLIAQTRQVPTKILPAVAKGEAIAVAKKVAGPIRQAAITIWKSGGARAFFAGNGLNVVKVFPESAIKFGSFEAAKRSLAKLEGAEDPTKLSSGARFLAGGIGGVTSQFVIYPIDTLKFRMQCSMVDSGLRGNKLIIETFRNTWRTGAMSFYRGLPLALCGIFPYSAIDMGTFEVVKRAYIKREAKKLRCKEADVALPTWMASAIGAVSGSVGAATVYPVNVLRTRLQAQGTIQHPQTYTGVWDVATKTFRQEGMGGMFRGLTPNLMKVVPAVSITYVVYEHSKRAMGLPN